MPFSAQDQSDEGLRSFQLLLTASVAQNLLKQAEIKTKQK